MQSGKKKIREISILLCKCVKLYYSTFNKGIAVLQESLQKMSVFAIIFFLLDCIVDIYIQKKRGRQHYLCLQSGYHMEMAIGGQVTE